jgi:DNA-directed RNA polymerase specialized sigma24 family protein
VSFSWHEIREDLMRSSSRLQFQRSFEALRQAHAALAPFRDPVALFDGLHRTRDASDDKKLILTALVEAAQSDGPVSDCALTVMLLALWPGLDAIRHRSIRRRIGSAEEITSEIMSRTTEAVRGLDLGRVTWIAATVLLNVERDMIRAHRKQAEHTFLTSITDPDDLPADRAGGQQAAEAAALEDELRRMIGIDALLVIRVAIEGYSQAEVAAEFGLTHEAARKRYQRAMRRLRAAFVEIP